MPKHNICESSIHGETSDVRDLLTCIVLEVVANLHGEC